MTLGSILLAVALLILVALFLARPFLTFPRRRQGQAGMYQSLLTQKEALLLQIRELDFDHETGKVPDEIYHLQRQHLITEAAVILRQLDELAVGVSDEQPPDTIEAEIEAAVAHLRRQRPRPKVRATNGTGRVCPQCGQPTDMSDKFCAACGHKLVARSSL